MSIFSQIRSILGKNEQEESAATPDKAKKVDAASMTATPGAPAERRSRKRINTHKGRRILIIDDSPTIVGALRKMLRSAGCITLEAADAESGLELIRKEKPELVFLDIVLPGMTGFAALRQMRRDPLTLHIPVIMISGNEQATEQFYVKRIGADDFMVKPVRLAEFKARVGALLRRAYPNDAQDVLEFGRFRFLPEARGLEMDGKPVELKAREYELALFLFQNMGRLLSRDHLREVIWGHSAEVISRSLDTHVSRLRSLLDLRPANGYMITAVYGVGYRFEAVKPTAEQTASGSASQAQ